MIHIGCFMRFVVVCEDEIVGDVMNLRAAPPKRIDMRALSMLAPI